MALRALMHIHAAEPVTDGDGVRIRRVAARRALHAYDPFLLLDEIAADDTTDVIGGFPEHPHRGFETVTYMREGRMQHRDHLGHEGMVVSGGVQWMTAGRGVLHSEMPLPDQGRLHGFQLWINLPAAEKMLPPGYREYGPERVPVASLGTGSEARVIAGTLSGAGHRTQGPITGIRTQPDYADIRIAAGDRFSLSAAPDKRILLYVYDGSLQVIGHDGGRSLHHQQLGMLGDGDQVSLTSHSGARLLWLAGRPLQEPIANWGPFVMNTREEIEQAIADYRNGTLTAAQTGDTQ